MAGVCARCGKGLGGFCLEAGRKQYCRECYETAWEEIVLGVLDLTERGPTWEAFRGLQTQEQKDLEAVYGQQPEQLGTWGRIYRLEAQVSNLRGILARMQAHCPWCREQWEKRSQGESLSDPRD